MAIKATIIKATVQVSDMDRGYYNDLKLTIAQHPSETDERTMVRILAFALNASEGLKFTEGISAEDEPDIWEKSLSNEIELWIDVGLPDERRIRKACNRAKRVFVYAYGGRVVPKWWEPIEENLARHQNLKVIVLPQTATRALANMAKKTMELHCAIQDGQIWMGDSDNNVLVEPEMLYGML
ncbi:MAG: YaeQ family protein [Nitrospinae bacterium]|nr:YaeQ family protein [Nitrospinota bacterium]MBF0635143.1 YaeQ family protein [Nitrospinota bacterium]